MFQIWQQRGAAEAADFHIKGTELSLFHLTLLQSDLKNQLNGACIKKAVLTAQSNTLASYHGQKTVTDPHTWLILKCLSETGVSVDCSIVLTCPGCDPAFS